MCAHRVPDTRTPDSKIEHALTWLGGGHWRELTERHERATYAVAGVIVLLGAVLAWLIATLAIAAATSWPVVAIAAFTFVFGVLVGAVTRAVASGTARARRSIAGRVVVALVVGVVVGELAALVLFSGSIGTRLDAQAQRDADSAPAVQQATADLEHTRSDRSSLDAAVERARGHRDQALVVARCEYHPTPACPETKITGVPGVGPETRTANDQLADAQKELEAAVTTRDQRAPALDAQIDQQQRAVDAARDRSAADVDHGLGARWVAMHDYTFGSLAALSLRLLTIAFFALLALLPLILRLWRGETTHDRSIAARAEQDRAEQQAQTAIAVKHAETRAAAESILADQHLERARLAAQAQTEIDREHHRRRVIGAVDGAVDEPVSAISRRDAVEDVPTELPAAPPKESAVVNDEPNLPARVEDARPTPKTNRFLPPVVDDVTKSAARWVRPLVPPIVARAIDTTTHPLRAARHVFEEVEEITFSLKRTRKVTVTSEEPAQQQPAPGTGLGAHHAPSEIGYREHPGYPPIEQQQTYPPLPRHLDEQLDQPLQPRQLPPSH